MKRSVHPGAARDLAQIAEFYRQSGSVRLAERLIDEFERVASLLVNEPGLGTPFDLPRRIHTLRVFPYSVVYKPIEQGIRVLAVRQHHRHPDFGKTRA